MVAYRKKTKISGRQLTLDLPPDLQNAEVEIWIVPIQSGQAVRDRSWLLQFPTWSEEDIKAIEEVSKKFNQWQITEF